MATLQSSELRRIETKYAAGITSAAVVKIFRGKGERFSEATLRKYVQLGLLPTSKRVGIRGRHRGSSGLYPCVIVRMANDIKRQLEMGHTLDAIRQSGIAMVGEVELLRRAGQTTFARLAEALAHGSPKVPALSKKLSTEKKAFDRQVRALHTLVDKLRGTREKA